MNSFNYERQILVLDDIELEKLVRKWADIQLNKKYISSMRYGGAGDMGRDVVGFYSKEKHEGEWDNYQCKQYNSSLPTDKGMLELGKILYFAHKGNFTLPSNYFFVAPKGVNRNLKGWILNPSQLKQELIKEWDKYCSTQISKGKTIKLDSSLRETIESFDFTKIEIIDIDTMVLDESFRFILVEEFGGELLPPPEGVVPASIDNKEHIYISKLLEAYSDHDGGSYTNQNDIIGHIDFEEDFDEQRERYYSADAFRSFYRDNTIDTLLIRLEKQILSGIKPISKLSYNSAYNCMCTVLGEAGKLQPSGKLSIHCSIDVKQGYCHHFVNEGKLKWKI